MDKLIPRIPFADWIDNGVDWLVQTFSSVFDGIAIFLETIVEGSVDGLAACSINLARNFICFTCLVDIYEEDCDILISRIFIHRLLRLLVSNASNARTCSNVSHFCYCYRHTDWNIGFTTSSQQEKLLTQFWISCRQCQPLST